MFTLDACPATCPPPVFTGVNSVLTKAEARKIEGESLESMSRQRGFIYNFAIFSFSLFDLNSIEINLKSGSVWIAWIWIVRDNLAQKVINCVLIIKNSFLIV